MIKELIQTALDTALNGTVRVYPQRKSGADANEYIVYTQNGDRQEIFADDEALIKVGSVTIRYYYRVEKLDTKAGRQAVSNREAQIESALESAGLTITNGKFDAGDVDDIGFFVTVFECEYSRVV